MRRAVIIGALGLAAAVPGSARADASMSAADLTVAENAGQATFTIKASEAPAADLTVTATTQEGTATEPEDYTSVSTTATIAAGTTSATVSVPIVPDSVDESDEGFALKLSNVQQAGASPVIGDDTATATITDDDPPPSLSIDDPTVSEPPTGKRNVTFTVKLSAPSGRKVTVKTATANGSARAPGDYEAQSGTLEFAIGQTSRTVAIKVLDDGTDEATERFELRQRQPGDATIADDRGTATINDGDPRPSLSIADTEVPEGSSRFSAAVSVTLSAASARTITVKYTTRFGSAHATSDYVATGGTLRIPAGEKQAFIPITIVGDGRHEPVESFQVLLAGPVNATLKDGGARVVILDDDRPAVKPRLRGFRLRPSVITSNGRALLSTVMNQKATLRIRLERLQIRKGARARWVTVRRFNVTVGSGLTRLKFAGGGLPPARYRFVATPRNANGTGAAERAPFRVKK